jgi:hypothetical protein
MRIPFWLTPWRQTRRTVAGLALHPGGVVAVILTGSLSAPDTVCHAKYLGAPDALHPSGADASDAQALSQGLRAFLQSHDQPLAGLCVCVDDAWVHTYTLGLPQALRGDDLHFQLMAELDAVHPEGVSHQCVAYTRVVDASAQAQISAVQRYRVSVMAQARVEALAHMASRVGVRVLAIETAADAGQRWQNNDRQPVVPEAIQALGWPCEEALGAALGAWTGDALSFSPSPAQHARRARHLWWTCTAASVSAGALLGCLGAWAIGWAVPPHDQPEVAASQRALDAAQQEALALQTQWQQAQALTQWWRSQLLGQQHSVQWSRVLAQETHGIWVSQVQQQDGHWVMQGEALSATHVHQLLQALTALGIWRQAPQAQRLQLVHGGTSSAMFTWQFRIEADLKDRV